MYRQRIQGIAPSYDPRHVEALMRSELGTLDDLSPAQFRTQVLLACCCIEEGGTGLPEMLAKTYGL